MRFVLLSAALVSFAAACVVPVRDASEDGGFTLEGYSLGMLAVALAVLAMGHGSSLAKASRFLALFLLGLASQLVLTEPLWLQYVRIRPHELAAPLPIAALAMMLLQAGIVVVGLRNRWRPLIAALGSLAGGRRLLPLSVVFLFAAAQVTLIWTRREEVKYLVFLILQWLSVLGFFALNLATLILAAASCGGAAVRRFATIVSERITLPGSTSEAPRRGDRWLPWGLAAWCAALSAFMALVVFDTTPHLQDEVSFLFQARCYGQGCLDVPPPPVPDAFDYYLLRVEDGKWYGAMNPGWPFLLAIAMKLGLTWLLNPLITGLTLLVVHAVTRRLAGRGMANLVGLLFSVSPWFLLVGGSVMTQPLSLLLTMLALLFALRVLQERSLLSALATGLVIGAQFLVRPMDALIVAVAVFGVGIALRGRRFRVTDWAAVAAGGLLTASWFLPFNSHFTGSPLKFTISDYFDKIWYPGADRLGFAADIGNPVPYRWEKLDPEPGHGLPDVLLNANQNIDNINYELFGFGTGSLILVVLLFLAGRRSSLDRSCLAFMVLVIAGYSTYWFSGGPDFGARYWYLVIYPLVFLSARGFLAFQSWLRKREPKDPDAALRVACAMVGLAVGTIAVFIPWRMIGKYPHYRGGHDDVRTLLDEGRFGDDLVLLKVDDQVEFGPALLLNTIPVGGPGPVFARDLGPTSVSALRAAFPERRVWRLEGRSVTHARTRIVSGPEPALRPR